jgi:hypothetical protein
MYLSEKLILYLTKLLPDKITKWSDLNIVKKKKLSILFIEEELREIELIALLKSTCNICNKYIPLYSSSKMGSIKWIEKVNPFIYKNPPIYKYLSCTNH